MSAYEEFCGCGVAWCKECFGGSDAPTPERPTTMGEEPTPLDQLRERVFASSYHVDEETIFGKMGAAQAYIRILEAEVTRLRAAALRSGRAETTAEQSAESGDPAAHFHEFDIALASVDGWQYMGCECGASECVGRLLSSRSTPENGQ